MEVVTRVTRCQVRMPRSSAARFGRACPRKAWVCRAFETRTEVVNVNNISSKLLSDASKPELTLQSWPIPRNIHEVSNGNILGFGADLSEDHPGFNDTEYKLRRMMISNLAKQHQVDQPIPEVEYTAEETGVWRSVISELRQMYPKHACKDFLKTFPLFEFKDDEYIRHPSRPSYTPEPDVCHELLGHVPMLADENFSRMIQAIGIASMGASDKEIWHLTKVYWYTVEFGVVMEAGELKAFGAGILSSFGELEHMASGGAATSPLDPFAKQPPMSYKDGYQQQYFSLDNFDEGTAMLLDYANKIRTSSSCSYNPPFNGDRVAQGTPLRTPQIR
eukprot:gene13415-19268_t